MLRGLLDEFQAAHEQKYPASLRLKPGYVDQAALRTLRRKQTLKAWRQMARAEAAARRCAAPEMCAREGGGKGFITSADQPSGVAFNAAAPPDGSK